jgi:hypothetical protein
MICSSLSDIRKFLPLCIVFGLFALAAAFPPASFQSNKGTGVPLGSSVPNKLQPQGWQVSEDELAPLDADLNNAQELLRRNSTLDKKIAQDTNIRIAQLQDRLLRLMNQAQSLKEDESLRKSRASHRILREAAQLRKEISDIERIANGEGKSASVASPKLPGKNATAATGIISGTVTDAASTLPISGIIVNIFDVNDAFVTSASTSPSGVYTTLATLATGTYYAVTSNSLSYLNKVYNNISCNNCDPNSGTPISVTSGSTTMGINFALTLGGKISGNVKDAGTMANLSGVTVQIYDSAGVFVTTVSTNASGIYTTAVGLQAGTYYARTTNNTGGYINQIYNNTTCVVCTLALGTPISVTAGSTASGINFSLTPGGRISGTVTNAATLAVIPSVQVQILHPIGVVLATTTTNGSGVYTCPVGLTTGSYYVRTNSPASPPSATGFINQVYNGVSCQNCNPALGTAVSVTTGSTTTGINFALTAGGRISGTVIDAVTSAPLQFVSVQIFNSGGGTITSGSTDASGNYISRAGLPTGTYYVQTLSQDRVDKVFNNINCQGCDVTKGTPISVTAGATTPAINFSLGTGGSISGTITNAANSAPLAGVEVDIYTPCQGFVTGVVTDGMGHYTMPNSLPTGTYFAVSFNDQGFIDKAYDNSPTCLVCDPTLGTPISVTTGSTTMAINFALSIGARISGVTADATNAIPITNSPNIYDANGVVVSVGLSTVFGNYLTPGLPAGTYYARSNNSAGYLNELYSNLTCVGGCTVTSGTPIALAAGATASGINFFLDPGGRITGNITNATTSAPLPNAFVSIYDSIGTFVATGTSDTFGNYVVARGLSAGTHYALTFNLQGFINKAYNNIICVGCTPTSTTGISVSTGAVTTGINFALSPGGGRISGTLTSAATSAPLPNVIVNFYNTSGAQATNTISDCSGNYTCDDGLTTGNYFVRTANTQGYVDQLYSNINCFACDPTTGTIVPATVGSNTMGINFALCHMALSSASAFFTINGDEASFNLTTSSGCSWSATSNDSWIELTSGSTGMGSATISYLVRDNFSLTPRQGTISIAGQTFTVTQDSETASDCTFAISPTFTSFSAGGAAGSIAVFAEERCAWQAVSNAGWITVTSNCCGIGNGAASYSVASNPGTSGRAGTITIAGKAFNIKQKGN